MRHWCRRIGSRTLVLGRRSIQLIGLNELLLDVLDQPAGVLLEPLEDTDRGELPQGSEEGVDPLAQQTPRALESRWRTTAGAPNRGGASCPYRGRHKPSGTPRASPARTRQTSFELIRKSCLAGKKREGGMQV